MTLRVAVLVKQVPRFEAMALGPDGRLQRTGLDLETNPYCRRAVSKGVELAHGGGWCTVITMGPPESEEVLREAIACGADEGLHVCDPQLAGSDTLATARTLAAVLRGQRPFDMILLGRNSVDADTGQVGPELAQLLGLPFLAAVRRLWLDPDGSGVSARCERDDGWADLRASLPAVLSCAERLCPPAKASPEERVAVPGDRIRRISTSDLGSGPWGVAASPTSVGRVRVQAVRRRRVVLAGLAGEQVATAVQLLRAWGALQGTGPATGGNRAVPASTSGAGPCVSVVLEPDRVRLARELLGAAARLAARVDGHVAALDCSSTDALALASQGTDRVVKVAGSSVEEDVATAVADWCRLRQPWAVLAPGTMWGREVAGRVAASLGAGLTGDAVDLTVRNGRLLCWKPALRGRLLAAISTDSPVQMATVRPGVLPLLQPRQACCRPPIEQVRALPRSSVRLLEAGRDETVERLLSAPVVIGTGLGVPPGDYPLLEALRLALGAELAATRKVTDRDWLPRARQVGITGHSISPRLYVAVGIQGTFNHLIGVHGAGTILAINRDPQAPIFDAADLGIVADWREVVPLLLKGLDGSGPRPATAARSASWRLAR
jgi:electron transfer flavoprotein alpha subunit